ncbi:sigma-54-dependent transcriptional regulator [Desulfonatronovibrio magnus]|uniref:sigma-54-dependent transcriptional regulator n=1 Tax=Desulfonatronovibrio magnus TaxID=698827 RepID=UPI0005EBD3D4|nr:sigma-54 dependent transcriptional regulator [Desulfonatronovibrio magnus]
MYINTNSNQTIYILDDEKSLLDSLFITLRSHGFEDIHVFNHGQDILNLLPGLQCRILLLDLFMPEVSGEEILEQISRQCPEVQVIVITGVNETDTAVRCMKKGAFDYLTKPVDSHRLTTTVRRALHHSVIVRQNLLLKNKLLTGDLENPDHFADIITSDSKMKSLFSYIEVIAPASDPVLITGETGTGKDLMARALHKASNRTGSFISLNAAGLDDNVFADTLFGHIRGAFTDAKESRKGLVEQAGGGTLFLDEIGDLPPPSQVKLLNLIQDKSYYPLGSDNPKKAMARIVAATNKELEDSVKKGDFRDDLFYRINTYHIHLPPLRNRKSDILFLAKFFHQAACQDLKISMDPLSPTLLELLKAYDYPGNIRELRSMIFGAMARGGLESLENSLSHLRKKNFKCSTPAQESSSNSDWDYPDPLPSIEQATIKLVKQAMIRSEGNQSQAARMLGISRQALNQRLKKYNDYK